MLLYALMINKDSSSKRAQGSTRDSAEDAETYAIRKSVKDIVSDYDIFNVYGNGCETGSSNGPIVQNDDVFKDPEEAPLLLGLPTDRPRLPHPSLDTAQWPIRISAQTTQLLKNLAHEQDIDLNVVVLTAWVVVLSRLTGQEDIVIALRSTDSGSQDSTVYSSTNSLALNVDLSGDPNTAQLLDRIKRSVLALGAHRHDLREETVDAVQQPLHRDGNPAPLQVAFNWCTQVQESGTVGWSQTTSSAVPVGFELVLHLRDLDDQIVGAMFYAPALFDSATIERHAGYLSSLLEGMASASNVTEPVAKIDMLSPSERTLLLQTWNATREDYPDHLCLHHLFEQQVARTPEAIAVVYDGQSLSYAQLNARANGLAHRLIKLGVHPDMLVVICVKRSPEMIIGLMAILKAGGAYVPLDPFHTSDRLRDIFADTAPTIVVADKAGRIALGEAALSSVAVVDPCTAQPEDANNPQIVRLTSRHLAYIIYTSGTTGKPKGVMLEHQGAVNMVHSRSTKLDINPGSRVLQFVSLSFTHSVAEIFSTLTVGASLYLVQDDLRLDRPRLWDFLTEHSMTHFKCSSSVLQDIHDLPTVETLRCISIGGEAMPPSLPRVLSTKIPNSAIFNNYGSTENSSVILWKYTEAYNGNITPIGRPIPNKRIYLLDPHGNPVPLGTVGELYVGGVGVARGYLNRPELTAKVFLPDPFVGGSEARMFKSGDMARYLPDGNLLYLGRNDFQVKVRGFRIELGEIEAHLTEHPLVSEAAVVAFGEGRLKRRLVAYVIAKPQEQLAKGAVGDKSQFALTLRSHLAKRLPEYMVPSAFVRMATFPLTSGGKVNRRALPTPGDGAFARQEYEAPQGEIETALAAIWGELLHVERVSRHDSFFALGGHSLVAVRLMSRVAALGANLPLVTLFTSPSVSAFAVEVKRRLGQELSIPSAIEHLPRGEALPLSFAQRRLWFLSQFDGVSNAYHIRLNTRLRGILDRKAWQLALDELLARHEALRSVFVTNNGEPHVRILPPEAMPMAYIDLRDTVNVEGQLATLAAKERHASFDLALGPLIRAVLVQLADNDHAFLLSQHHIVSDGWSSAIILRELSQLYTAYCRGEPNPLPPLAIQYPDYAAWQRQWLSEDRLKSQTKYWRTTLAGAPVLIELPTDRPRPPQQSFAGSHVPIVLDAQITGALKRLSQVHGVTLFMTILAAWSAVLFRLSNQDDIVIGAPSANRGHQEIEPLIGFFVSTLALRVDLSGNPTVRNLLERVRQSTLGAYGHQDLPFERVVEIVQPLRKLDHTPLFQVMFAWQNHEAGDWNLPDLDATAYKPGPDTAMFDLTLRLCESDQGIVGSLIYATSLFERSTIEKHIGYLCVMLQAMAEDSEQRITAIDLLSSTERTLLLQTWNATQEDYPDHLCLHHLFEQQVARTPEAIVVVHDGQSLTYAQLNARANCLAHRLIELSVQPGAIVAICVERSLSMVIGILAILKAGGVYLPLDPYYASDRLRVVLDDAAPTILVADKTGRTVLGASTISALTVVDPNNLFMYSAANPQIAHLTSRHLAYVIYTSGSTGRPKGVMVEHQGLVNFINSLQSTLQVNSATRLTQFSSIGFDMGNAEIFHTICFGGSLHVLSDNNRLDRYQMWEYLKQHAITHATFTPSTLHDCKHMSFLTSLRMVVVAGEAMPPSLPQNLKVTAASCTIINAYGPTETTIGATLWKCTEAYNGNIAPIGRPIPNKRIYLLDPHGNPVPLGTVGELYIGGVGVARGYLNRPELTAEVFLPDPFVGGSEARMYKSGDLARYLPDGNLLYLGRNDFQVKVSGFRIDLGEIEAHLTDHHLVSEAVVVAVGEGKLKTQLVAYVIAKSVDQLRESVSGAQCK
ncbi:hypothetical protein BGZ74_002792 [Mortierella antarctica]|nr:hypothetical protein BGZ74_002792 [Mortierella antarctica]